MENETKPRKKKKKKTTQNKTLATEPKTTCANRMKTPKMNTINEQE